MSRDFRFRTHAHTKQEIRRQPRPTQNKERLFFLFYYLVLRCPRGGKMNLFFFLRQNNFLLFLIFIDTRSSGCSSRLSPETRSPISQTSKTSLPRHKLGFANVTFSAFFSFRSIAQSRDGGEKSKLLNSLMAIATTLPRFLQLRDRSIVPMRINQISAHFG